MSNTEQGLMSFRTIFDVIKIKFLFYSEQLVWCQLEQSGDI